MDALDMIQDVALLASRQSIYRDSYQHEYQVICHERGIQIVGSATHQGSGAKTTYGAVVSYNEIEAANINILYEAFLTVESQISRSLNK